MPASLLFNRHPDGESYRDILIIQSNSYAIHITDNDMQS